MRIFVPIKLRTCTLCGHEECSCCVRSCDSDDSCPCFSEGDDCVYAEPPDAVGYAALEAAVTQLGIPCGESRVKGGLLVFSDDDEPTEEELEAMR